MRRLAPLLILLAAGAWATSPMGLPARKKLAGLVVRSKDWTVHRLKHDTVEEWTGDVSYRQKGREVYADWAERHHSNDLWKARGHVRILWEMEDGNVLEARGEEARHDGDLGDGWMRPRKGGAIQFERMNPELPSPDHGLADRLAWNEEQQTVDLVGHVHTWGPSGESWADKAQYRNEARELVLTGHRPVLVSGKKDWNGAVQADQVTASDRPHHINADGAAHGWLIFEERPGQKKKHKWL